MPKRWLPALRGALQTKGLAERVRSSSVTYSVAGTPYEQRWNTNRAVREGFQHNPWVFRACEVIAYTALRRRIVMRLGDPENGPQLYPSRTAARAAVTSGEADSLIDDTRLLYVLNRRANPWETAGMLRYRLICQWLLSSKGVYLEVTRARSGRFAMLTLHDPDLLEVVPSATNPISAFRMRTAADTSDDFYDELPPFDPAADPEDQPNSILWLRSPHPTILTHGMSPMEAAGLSVDLDRYARLYNRDYMQAGGRPGGILGIRGSVDPDTVTAIQNRFNRNSRPGEVTALQADAMFYQDLSTAPRDLQWGDTMDRARKEASMVFGVPESMMGDASGRTFDNADAEYAIFLEHRFAPLIGLIDDQLDVLTGAEDDDRWLRHDMSDLWVLKRHRRAEEDRMAAEVERGTITFNDYREFLNLEPIDAPWAKVHWIKPGLLAGYVHDPADATAASKTPMAGQPQPAQPGEEAALGASRGASIANYNAQTNAGAAQLRLAAAAGQGRSPAGGQEALFADARTPELEAKAADETEGEQRRGRSGPAWR